MNLLNINVKGGSSLGIKDFPNHSRKNYDRFVGKRHKCNSC